MDEFDDFDPGLFGLWELRSNGCGGDGSDDAVLEREMRAVLEVKSAEGQPSPGEDLRRLLNEMTAEMRAQFSTFRQMREGAVDALAGDDEAAQKLARADIKAATDAMSLIVRTLEKVDSLQRQLSRDREIEAERVADEGGYEEARARLQALIEVRAHDRAKTLLAEWIRDGAAADAGAGANAGAGAGLAADAAGGDGAECAAGRGIGTEGAGTEGAGAGQSGAGPPEGPAPLGGSDTPLRPERPAADNPTQGSG